METALSGQTVRFMFEDSPIGMCSITAAGRVLRRNTACEAFLPAEADSIFAIVAGGARSELDDAMRAVCRGSQRVFRMSADTTDGRRVEISGIPMRGGSGELMVHLVDVTEHHVREQNLRELAEHDALTGLLNRLSFNRAFDQRLKSQPYGTLMMIDLDGFKKVNDTRGHQTGDAVLVVVAQALRDAVGDLGIVARLGGDEFAVLLDSDAAITTNMGAILIRRITIAASLATRGIPVSASIGTVKLDSGATATALIEAADRAMYAAKRAGKGRCVVATMQQPANAAC